VVQVTDEITDIREGLFFGSVQSIEDELDLADLVLHLPGRSPQLLDDREEVLDQPQAIQALNVSRNEITDLRLI